ncbi:MULTISPECIES: hypothetical protein [unclassified Pseudomonas]|uniref:hypothetical protein n=1 Tax=unclassified Pseudomonas TaxID=196821 RepID=UPI00235EFA7E|nr:MULTISPECIES: hypothetical protein [unclassified Pseudomonas]
MLAASLPWDLPVKLFFNVENVTIPAAPVATDQRRRCAFVTLPGPHQEGAGYGSCWPSFKLAKRSGRDPQVRPRRGVESC